MNSWFSIYINKYRCASLNIGLYLHLLVMRHINTFVLTHTDTHKLRHISYLTQKRPGNSDTQIALSTSRIHTLVSQRSTKSER